MSAATNTSSLKPKTAGSAVRDITPNTPQFLFGYPHVERTSTGVHDPLLASAVYINDGGSAALFISVDLLSVTKQLVTTAREQITAATGMPAESILISATHTHSAPITMRVLSNADDEVVPEADPRYVAQVLAGIVDAGIDAIRSATPATLGLQVQNVFGLGTNRHDPDGPSYSDVPVLVVRAESDLELIGLMCVCAMHPTVLHEDSKLISGDFPGCAREYLRSKLGIPDLCLVYHMGAAGNQSPRHVVHSNTFAEAERLGRILGDSLLSAIEETECTGDWHVDCETTKLKLPLRSYPSVEEAQKRLQQAASHFAELTESGAERAIVRTAECDLFGAQETLTLSRAQHNGQIQSTANSCMPAEIQMISVGRWTFVAWPGEVFTEYALELQKKYPNTFVITNANGELQGYLVTAEAVEKRAYEASNAMFQSPESPELLLAATVKLLEKSLEPVR